MPFIGKVTAFADDLAIAYRSHNAFNLFGDINHDVSLLREWFASHKLIVSNKTKLMYFSLGGKEVTSGDIIFHSAKCLRHKLSTHTCIENESKVNYFPELNCDAMCFNVEVVQNFRYLGVIVDQNLSWSSHISAMKVYMLATVRSFYRLQKLCASSVLKMIYYGLVQSKLQYGISCWGSAYSNKIRPLLMLQKCLIRRICNASRLTHSMNLFKRLNILPVRHLYYFKVLKIFFMRSGYLRSPIYTTLMLRSNSHSNVTVPASRTTLYRNFYTIVSCMIFNKLPNYIQSIRNIGVFLKLVKLWLLGLTHDDIEVLLRPII